MRKILPIAVVLTSAGLCLIAAAYFCHFYYTLYRSTLTELDGRINSFDMRLTKLEAHKARELTPVRIWGIISTTDRAPDESMSFYSSSEPRATDFFEAIGAKGGPLIRPEIRVPAGSTTNCEYDIYIGSQFGIVADAWLTHAAPYQSLAAFDDFRVYSPNKTNIVRLLAHPKAGASVHMRFDIVVLCEK